MIFYWISLALNEANRHYNFKVEERKGALGSFSLEELMNKNIKEYTHWKFLKIIGKLAFYFVVHKGVHVVVFLPETLTE